MSSFRQSESLVLLQSIINAFELTEPPSSTPIPMMPSQDRVSSMWFIGFNGENECNLPSEESDEYSRRELTLCEWSLQKEIISVTVGSQYNIYTIKSKKDDLLCFGFLRESQRIFAFKKNLFYIIPEPVFALCFRYLGRLKQYWAAGYNENGQCGVGTVDPQIPLSRIEGVSDILKVKSGVNGENTLWIKYDGNLYVNGTNDKTQLVMSGTNNIRIPTLSPFTQQHPELRCVDGASSLNFNVLIADNGSVWFAGATKYGRLDSGRKFIPLDAPPDVHIVSVAAGEDYMLFRTRNGSVLSFGENQYGQLGLSRNLKKELSRLQLISFFDEHDIKIKSVRCGRRHNLALSTDGKVYGFGANYFGQCGVSDGANRKRWWTPELIDIGLDIVVRSIECGYYHSGLITMDNEVYLWGDNTYNQCCANMESEKIKKVFTPQNVTDYVLSKSKKDVIIDIDLGVGTTMFLLE